MSCVWNHEVELLMGTLSGFVSSRSATRWSDLAGRENHDGTAENELAVCLLGEQTHITPGLLSQWSCLLISLPVGNRRHNPPCKVIKNICPLLITDPLISSCLRQLHKKLLYCLCNRTATFTDVSCLLTFFSSVFSEDVIGRRNLFEHLEAFFSLFVWRRKKWSLSYLKKPKPQSYYGSRPPDEMVEAKL